MRNARGVVWIRVGPTSKWHEQYTEVTVGPQLPFPGLSLL